MLLLIKLFYAGAIAALMILLVAFGVRTFYSPPEEPRFISDGRPIFLPGVQPTAEEMELYNQQQQEFQARYEHYTDSRADYRAKVFIVAAAIGIIAVAGGLALSKSLDAIRLGLVSGGLGTILYGIVQAAGDLDGIGPGVIFLISAAGLVLMLASGYRWLGSRVPEP